MAVILIVEDELQVCERLERAIERQGHVAITALELIQAFNAIENDPDIEVILLDLNMPIVPGLLTNANRAGLDAIEYFVIARNEISKKKQLDLKLPPIIAFTSVSELIEQAAETKEIFRVIYKGDSNWEEDLLESISSFV